MKLYQIDVSHSAPKDTHFAIQGYLIAENDDEVYDFIRSEPTMNGEKMINGWATDEAFMFEYEDEDCSLIIEETFRERMIRLGGQIEDDTVDFSTAHYGITLYGWREAAILTDAEIDVLVGLGIAVLYDATN